MPSPEPLRPNTSHMELVSGFPFPDEDTEAWWRSCHPRVRAACPAEMYLIFNFIECFTLLLSLGDLLGPQLEPQGFLP